MLPKAEETDPRQWWRKGCGHKGPGKTPRNSIRGHNRRQEQCLGSKKAFYEALGLEAVANRYQATVNEDRENLCVLYLVIFGVSQ
jgi:hypothetical protein